MYASENLSSLQEYYEAQQQYSNMQQIRLHWYTDILL